MWKPRVRASPQAVRRACVRSRAKNSRTAPPGSTSALSACTASSGRSGGSWTSATSPGSFVQRASVVAGGAQDVEGGRGAAPSLVPQLPPAAPFEDDGVARAQLVGSVRAARLQHDALARPGPAVGGARGSDAPDAAVVPLVPHPVPVTIAEDEGLAGRLRVGALVEAESQHRPSAGVAGLLGPAHAVGGGGEADALVGQPRAAGGVQRVVAAPARVPHQVARAVAQHAGTERAHGVEARAPRLVGHLAGGEAVAAQHRLVVLGKRPAQAVARGDEARHPLVPGALAHLRRARARVVHAEEARTRVAHHERKGDVTRLPGGKEARRQEELGRSARLGVWGRSPEGAVSPQCGGPGFTSGPHSTRSGRRGARGAERQQRGQGAPAARVSLRRFPALGHEWLAYQERRPAAPWPR